MKRLAKALVWIIATLVIMGTGLVLAENGLRKTVPERFAEHTREFLELSPDHPVDVKLEGIILWQLLTNKFQNVSLSVPDVPLKDGLRATLSGSAAEMPLDPTKGELKDARVSATFNEDELSDVLRVLSRGVGQDVHIEADHIVLANSFNLFGQSFGIEVSFELAAKAGMLHINPVGVKAPGLGGFTLDQLSNVPGLAKVIEGFDICIADKLPAGLTLQEVQLSTTKNLTVILGVDERIGIDTSLQEFGSCE